MYVLLSAAESYDMPSSLTPRSPATSDDQSLSSYTVTPEAEPANEPEAASAIQPEADVSRLESFLHTVTTADEVLNDLLGELSRASSSSSPAQMSGQSSSSALPKLAGEQNRRVAAADSDCFALAAPADEALQSSSSVQQDATGTHASSTAALHSDMPFSELQSPRSTTDAVLDTLLEDLRTVELARQSSSSVLLSRLTTLAEMRRQSASSSPVAGTSQADMLRQPSSSSELPVAAVNCDSADSHAHSASSHPAEPSCSINGSCYSPMTLPASQQLFSPSSSSSSSSSSSCSCSCSSSHIALEKADEEGGQDCSAAAPAIKKDVGKEEELDEEEVTKLLTVVTSDLVLDELLDDARLALEPESTANKVVPLALISVAGHFVAYT